MSDEVELIAPSPGIEQTIFFRVLFVRTCLVYRVNAHSVFGFRGSVPEGALVGLRAP